MRPLNLAARHIAADSGDLQWVLAETQESESILTEGHLADTGHVEDTGAESCGHPAAGSESIVAGILPETRCPDNEWDGKGTLSCCCQDKGNGETGQEWAEPEDAL